MKLSFFITIIILCISCNQVSSNHEEVTAGSGSDLIRREQFSLESMPVSLLTELRPCDIIVKPNLNYIPGTTFVDGGYLFGHAAIVIKGATGSNQVELLSKAITFESNARDVPAEYQVRQVAAYVPGNDNRYANDSFSPERFGNLYRLRMDLTEAQRDSIIAWLLAHDDDLSHYRAGKRFRHNADSGGKSPLTGEKLEYWYCSLLIWQAFYDVLGIDIDANKGYYVHPNDLVNSPYFDGEGGNYVKRVRF